MAFNIANRSSLRLNHILVGQAVDLCDFSTKKVIHNSATFAGWTLNGESVEAPKVIKSAEQGIQMHFTVPAADDSEPQTVTLVKDPNGFGAMFIETVTGEGDAAVTKLRRVTAYASDEVIQQSKSERHPPKAEDAPVEDAAPVDETVTVEETA